MRRDARAALSVRATAIKDSLDLEDNRLPQRGKNSFYVRIWVAVSSKNTCPQRLPFAERARRLCCYFRKSGETASDRPSLVERSERKANQKNAINFPEQFQNESTLAA